MLNALQVLPMWLTSGASADFMLAIADQQRDSAGTAVARSSKSLFIGGWKPAGASGADISGLPSSHSPTGSLGTCCHILPINYSTYFSPPGVVGLLARRSVCCVTHIRKDDHPGALMSSWLKLLPLFATSHFYSFSLHTAVSWPKQGFQALDIN